MKFLKGIGKVLGWFVNFKKQYHKQQKEYQKCSPATKIIVYLILPLIFTAGAIALEIWTFKIFENHFGWGVLAAIACVAVIVVSLRTTGLNAAIALLNIARVKAGNAVANMVESAENSYQTENGESVVVQALSEDIVSASQPDKKYKKWVDLFVGIGCLILAVGLFVAAITLLILRINNALMAL